LAAIAGAGVDPVLDLQAAHGDNEAGIGDVGAIGRDLVVGGRTTLRLGLGSAKYRQCRQQTYLENSLEHRLTIDEVVIRPGSDNKRSATITGDTAGRF
jgi:hypothetical protein